jgi:YD repeat-containing protein
MALPVPIPTQVANVGSQVTVGWMPLDAGLDGLATLRDATGADVGHARGADGMPFCAIPAPAGWTRPPYTVDVAAVQGATTGPASPAVPVLIVGSTLSAVAYDGRLLALTVTPPPGDGSDLRHIPTTTIDGVATNHPAFSGISGTAPLPDAVATSDHQVQITDLRTVPVQGSSTCDCFGPPGAPAGIITQPATITGAQHAPGGGYDVDATGPTSVGPAVTGHRFRFGGADADAPQDELDLPAGGGRIPAAAAAVVAAAGTATSGGATIRGPFSAAYVLVDEVPAGVRLTITADGVLRAAWKPIAPLPPPLTITYAATLRFGDAPHETRATAAPGVLTVAFATPLPAGVVCSVTVLAVSSANSSGPASAPGRGPLRAVATKIGYDELGRLTSVPFDGWGTWTYTYDDLGNVLTATLAPPP